MKTPYVIILAGGSGVRFWPISRKSSPKQLLPIFGGKSLLEQSLNRMMQWVEQEKIFILTNQEQSPSIEKILPNFPKEQILTEPEKRDTAPAIAFAAGKVYSEDKEATLIVVPADHIIQDDEKFRKTLETGLHWCENSLVTIGIRPTWPSPEYGYIECEGDSLSEAAPFVHKVKQFVEKPSAERAEEFLKKGGFVWNSGIFIWKIPFLLEEMKKQAPELGRFALKVAEKGNLTEDLKREFSQLNPSSIDYALVEKTQNIINIRGEFAWSDMGSFVSLEEFLEKKEGNRTNCSLFTEKAKGNLVFVDEEMSVSLLGVDDLIIVQTKDILFISSKEKIHLMKSLVGKIPKEFL